MSEPAVSFRNITKRFPGVVALEDVSVDVAAGSCHALCGENGAGKSTLAKILGGIYRQDSGEVLVFGKPVRFSSPRDALESGIGIVHQELAFCDNMSVAENLSLSALPSRFGFVSRQRMFDDARAMLAGIDDRINPDAIVRDLSIAQQQMLQIAVAVSHGARIIVFDEPTSSLTHGEAERLHQLVRELKARGVTSIYVSHRLPEIFDLCDTLTVLRDGRHIATRPITEWTEADLIQNMIGRALTEYFPQHRASAPGETLLEVEHLECPGKFHDIALTVRAGEIVGLAGLVGAGRSEIACALFGLQATTGGAVRVRGRPVVIKGPRDAIALGIGLVPEDRKRCGLVLPLSATHNTTLPILKLLSRFRWVNRLRERSLVSDLFERLNVRKTATDVSVAGLSGGNQQKIVLAKWLGARSQVLILDEPTRGVDVGAKAQIHRLIDELAAQGHAILLISSELPELLSLATRIVVIANGRITGELPANEATQESVLRLMAAPANVA